MLAQTQSHPALVAKTDLGGDAARYLLMTPAGATQWVEDPGQATPFTSMREAMRMALRLPSNLRAYGMLQGAEAMAH